MLRHLKMKPQSPGASFFSSNHGSKQEALLYPDRGSSIPAEPRRLPRAPLTLTVTPHGDPSRRPRPLPHCPTRGPGDAGPGRPCGTVRPFPGPRCAHSPASPGPTAQQQSEPSGTRGPARAPPPPTRGRDLLPGRPRPPCHLPLSLSRQEIPSPAPAGRAVPGASRRSRPVPSASSSSSSTAAAASALPAPRAGTLPHAGRAPPRLRAIGWRGCQSKGAARGAPAVSRNMAALPPHPPQPLMTPRAPIPSFSQA